MLTCHNNYVPLVQLKTSIMPRQARKTSGTGVYQVMEVQNLEKNKRNSIIREVCKQGAGFRQLARTTGICYGIIQRVVTDQRIP